MQSAQLVACYHCGEPAVAGFSAEINGEQQPFCCGGCQAVAKLIHNQGLAGYYQSRTELGSKAELLATEQFSAFDSREFQAQHILQSGDIAKLYLHIEGLHCAACVWLIEQHLGSLDGVKRCSVNLSTGTACLQWQTSRIQLSELMATIHALGYQASISQNDQQQKQQRKQAMLRLGVAGFGMMQVGMFSFALYAGDYQGITPAVQQLMRLAAAITATAVILLAATPFFSNAWRGLRQGHVVMDLPVAIAIGLAYTASLWATATQSGEVYFDSVSMFTFFLLLSRHVEGKLKQQLGYQQQRKVWPQQLKQGDDYLKASDTTVEALTAGDVIWLEAGQTLPVDATLLSPQAIIDESVLSGESEPVTRQQNEPIYAGSINTEQVLKLQVTAVGAHTRLAQLEQMQFEAQQQRPRWQSLADTLAPKFIVTVLGLAALSFTVWSFVQADQALWVALAVLVVSCPCALSLATPTVYTAALSRLASQGIVLSSSQLLERLAKVDCVVFDKTGTLTEGKPVISHCEFSSGTVNQWAQIAASLEHGAHHPIALAFEAYRGQHHLALLPVSQRNVVSGQGIHGIIEGKRYVLGKAEFCQCEVSSLPQHAGSEVVLAVEQAGKRVHVATFYCQDALRASAKPCQQGLHALGIESHIASGDKASEVARIANDLAINHWQAACSAEQKLHSIQRLQQQGHVVLSVGDGLNDLILLGGADVSVAVNNASDLTKTTADVSLLKPQLQAIPQLIKTAKAAKTRIQQNLVWALAYNLCLVPLAMAGLLAPWQSAIGMSLSSIIVVLNARRV